MKRNKSTDQLIENSGMITHHKAISLLREQGWKLLVAPYYYDNISNTVREIDIIAEKQFNSSEIRQGSSVQINVQLFIECKYIKQEIAFWFDDKSIDEAVVQLEKNTDLQILHNKYQADITTDKFHYLNGDKVAKLFSTNTNKEDVIYKAITQCLNSKIYYDQWSNHPIYHKFFEHRETTATIIKYPIIICDNFDNLIKVEFDDEKYSCDKLNDNFQLQINYTYLDKTKTKAITDDFIIDLVSLDKLISFLNTLEIEIVSIITAKDFVRLRNAS